MRRRPPSRLRRLTGLLIIALLAYGGWRAVAVLRASGLIGAIPSAAHSPSNLREVFGPAQLLWLAGDLNADGLSEVVAVSPLLDGARRLALLVRDGSGYRRVGAGASLQWPGVAPELSRVDLPGAPGSLLATMRLPSGEEQFQAFTINLSAGLVPLDYYRLVAPQRSERSLILVDKRLNVLYYYRNGEVIMVARAATGTDRQGPPSARNRYTPEGRFRIAVMQANPSYTSPDGRRTWVGGAPDNPLGTRWMGFSVLERDVGWLFGIQGTNEPHRLGTWSTDGSIRLSNSDAERLFTLVTEGTPLEIR